MSQSRHPIKASVGSPYARIYGMSGYSPSRIVTNEEVCTWIESSDEWIRTRSGITERHWATGEETVEYMAAEAAKKAIERSGVPVEELGAIIVSTVGWFTQTPSLACVIAGDLGSKAAAYDISAACAGYSYALAQADALVRSGAAKYVLAIGVERLSDLTDQNDRSTAFIFGDGAGAAVVGPSDEPGIGPVVWGSDAEQGDLIQQVPHWPQAVAEGKHPVLVMNGNPVFKWAAFTVCHYAEQALAAAGLAPEDLDVFVPHQANDRITQAMVRTLKLPESVLVSHNIAHTGNSSAASIPMAIEALYEDGQVHSGETCLIIGFGAGLVYSGQVIVLP
ncbi:beta-ketoacyl-ACP synthase III [Raineyella fluvialis]|uniref:Beta-ketoacyl-[acyl-carrier-protein] synthase III n=1 Tax=Raineyella fluvialis TaxID=2662261 RepID=A0A5Q2FIA0_9ACTN|nr:beta-ketoacyl-ACP synthase III [Raineyella fluvialis]QGF24385.1 beta-ketoacyl-ACP synthase III [Raineyella fluvialis]